MHQDAPRRARAGARASTPISALATLTGALALATLTLATPALATSKNWAVKMTGGAEVPGPGNVRAAGNATIIVDDAANTLCYAISETGMAAPTAAHVHKGAKGREGPPVVPLQPPHGGSARSCATIEHGLATAILADPAGYYVNIHSAKYPKGAIRGQL